MTVPPPASRRPDQKVRSRAGAAPPATYRQLPHLPADPRALPALLSSPLLVGGVLAVIAQALFLWGLATPSILVFDETHYVPAARQLWSLAGPTNIEHPLLGKTLIGLGIALFGDNSFGWRVMSSVAGTATLVGLFAIAWLMFKRLRPAVLAALFALLNFTLYIQARIAMLDAFMAAFVVWAVVAMLWAMRGQGAQVRRRWLAGAVLLGLAAGVKWVALPYIGLAAAAFMLARSPTRWPGLSIWGAAWRLGLGSGAAYLLTFAPAFFYAQQPLTLATLLPFQLEMFRQQTQVLPTHTYQSSWWSWPLLLRPIWYLYEPADGAQRGVLMLGNPAVMWGGLVAVAACGWAWLREKSAVLGGVVALWLAAWGMWALIPKSLGFFYYYYLPSLWLPLVIAAAWDRFGRARLAGWDEAYLGLCAGLFVYFFPIISAAPLAGPQAFERWMWLSGWP